VLHICEEELNYLDMAISNKKSCCIRIGPRFSREYVSICTTSGFAIPWAREVRYLDIFIKASYVFKCSLVNAGKCFYRAANAVFGEVGRIASEEVVLQLITGSTKCVPALMYGLEA